jgi:hypothetical protein
MIIISEIVQQEPLVGVKLAGWVYFPEIHELNVRLALVPACQADQQEDNGVFHAGKIKEFFVKFNRATPPNFIAPNSRSSGKTFVRRAKAMAGRISFPMAGTFYTFVSATKEIH